MAKKERSEYSKLREKFLKKVRRLERRGYFFPEDYIPKLTKTPTEEDVNFYRINTTGDEIYYHAKWGRHLGEYARSGIDFHEQELENKRARDLINITKINTKRKLGNDNSEEYNKALGKELAKFYIKLAEEQKSFESSALSRNIPSRVKDWFENYITIDNAIKREERLKEEQKDDLLSELNARQAELEEEIKEIEKQKSAIQDATDDEAPITDEPVEETKRDPKYEEWLREYKEERKKKPKERTYTYDPEAIYAGILDRISQFERLMDSDGRFALTHGINKQYVLRLQGILNLQIKLEGFENVMKRLDKNGQRIEELLQKMLFEDSKEGDINPNFQELVQIIKGEKLSMKEAEMVEQYAIEHSYSQDTEDGEEYME